MRTHDIIVESEDDYKKLSLTTANTNYIASLEGYIERVQIEFTGENLPSISAADITSDITFTFESISDTSSDQSFSLTLDSGVNAVNLSFTFAGHEYVCHIYRGATIEGIAYGPNTPVQPPISETWTGDTTGRVYLLQQKTGEVVLNRNWEVPPQIASTEVFIQEDGNNYTARLLPVANPPAGNYVIKYCNQPLINVTVN